MKAYLLDLSLDQLQDWLTYRELPAYRAEQIIQWVYHHRAESWQAMTNLPSQLRDQLADSFELYQADLHKVSLSEDGTQKLLLRWPDQSLTETVRICDGKRQTVCISSQVGCAVGCTFCASGMEGLERSLTAGQIIEQALWVQRQLTPEGRISNIVMMGMGEPLANYRHVLNAVKTFNAVWGLNIGARHITISTIGLPEKIRKLAHEPFQFTLAVSLHAGDEKLRQELIPWAKRIPTKELFDAIDYFYRQTHREVTLEYVLLDGVNASRADADQLAYWSRQSRCNVNLINYNEVAELPYQRVPAQAAGAFLQWLKAAGVNAHLRPSRGREIDAACGQLRRRV